MLSGPLVWVSEDFEPSDVAWGVLVCARTLGSPWSSSPPPSSEPISLLEEPCRGGSRKELTISSLLVEEYGSDVVDVDPGGLLTAVVLPKAFVVRGLSVAVVLP